MERSAQLAALNDQLGRVSASAAGRLCLVAGEAGGGKTALVRRFCAEHPRARVLWGACDPLFITRPLGPFADIGEASDGELGRVVRGQARAHQVAAEFLAELRSSPPVIAVLEDLHWADEATLDVLRLIARRIDSAPGMVIVTYRDDELARDHPLRIVLGELPRHELITRLKLEALSEPAVAELAEPLGIDAVELHRATAGNPFFVTEVLASPGGEIPTTVRDAVLARAARLTQPARDVLDAVAVMPLQAELWLLASVAGSNLSAIGECLAAGILARREGAVIFRHDLARRAIEDSIPPDRALELHRKTLEALAGSQHGAFEAARLAHHAERSGDDAALLRYGRMAGERAASVGAHREAVSQLARALRAAGVASPIEHAHLLELFAHASLHVSRVDQSIDAEEEAIEIYRRQGEVVQEANALRRLSRFYICGVRLAEARQPIVRAVELLENVPLTRELALVHAGLAMYYMNVADVENAIRAGRRAIELGERLADNESLLHSLNSLGVAEMLLGDPRGRDRILRSLEMAEEMGLDEDVGRAYMNLAGVAAEQRDYEGFSELVSRGVEYCSQHGLELWRMWLLASEAKALLDRGDWSRAAEAANEVLHGERGQLPRINALPVLGLVRARRGDPDVWSLLDEARTMAERQGGDMFVAAARTEAAWLEGRWDDAVAESEADFGTATAKCSWWNVGDLSVWRRRAGARDEVHPKLPERYLAELEGDFARAASIWSALGCEYDAAMALAGADDPELLQQSLAKLQRLGARAAATVVARKLRALGVSSVARGPRPTTQRNPAMLTDRELEVLELVAAGLRNAEIAKRLFLAPKTVDHHVSAILRKLAVESRAEAGRTAAKLGLVS
ncbi:MAG TPA: AAA family ATPase [Candidatus Dormibacteraeota bacterium]|nr:AAA family ATPase [Candidatus Dormibacteraeota bacterium]